jgi:hypothetical protein
MLFFPCRVCAATEEEAQRLIIAAMARQGLEPVGQLMPRPCFVQPFDDVVWWECYAQCVRIE